MVDLFRFVEAAAAVGQGHVGALAVILVSGVMLFGITAVVMLLVVLGYSASRWAVSVFALWALVPLVMDPKVSAMVGVVAATIAAVAIWTPSARMFLAERRHRRRGAGPIHPQSRTE